MAHNDPLHIAFLWHMHQPLYRDSMSGEYMLPWVRLHGTKDYYDMAAILEKYPNIHQTFNVVPSLIEQIIDYTNGGAKDRFLEVTIKPADELSINDKRFILEKFFLANWENMVMRFPRYWELLVKRGFNCDSSFDDAIRYYALQDFLDLQVLFNLAWIDPVFCTSDKFLNGLAKKGRDFLEEEKIRLIEKQKEILKSIIPKYRELKNKGIIELSTSPYYHPILPLLCDTDSAKEAMPWVELPNSRFIHPEDAVEQVRRGIELHKDIFGDMPRGMWPPEGSVSEQVVPIIAKHNIKWIATDEGILAQSLGRSIRRDSHGNCLDPHTLYSPYSVSKDGKELAVVFRDYILSDRIGFVYSKWDAEKAADDFIKRLLYIRDSLRDVDVGNYLVTIALDGENAWEHFKNDGNDFLNALYFRLSDSKLIRAVTISEYIEKHAQQERLTRLFAGSWINHNFKIWIGHFEDNTAWDHLSEARNTLESFENSIKKKRGQLSEEKVKLRQAWEEIYAAEGSDWFWWYGEDHSSMSDIEFDELFRNHLKKVYLIIGKDVPPGLDVPIISEERVYAPAIRPISFIEPVIDGEITNYFEWLSSGRIELEEGGAAMHRTGKKGGSIIASINYGFNLHSLFFSFNFLDGIVPSDVKWSFSINLLHPEDYRIEADIDGSTVKRAEILEKNKKGDWIKKERIKDIASKDIVEIAVPFKAMDLKAGTEMRFFLTICGDGFVPERWPRRGYIVEHVPDKDFEAYNWRV